MNKREAIAALAKLIGVVSELPDEPNGPNIHIHAFFHRVDIPSMPPLLRLFNEIETRDCADPGVYSLNNVRPVHGGSFNVTLFGPKEVICQ